ncbi:hypothetical protein EMIHUDRAFT_225073 [Emiliania huxleyi CCMP1516]|uniref:t-SNARE coiled-coil homology domain-containing protein n=2 Tax=Emiliania huxleyi TaxID=2903 RepID=A0A0D3IV23_EMIH1|nr:hypothetical protein EMIHUDRAFT_246092 [Emiliania huxleyi CCMP1516]XP_005790241.1 hypothetical protein EMIHUDRAFT_225073 [Emiliania huxleyi CCMP1516]EOD15108.1 hypothetical protein EMIHUDRAFT_246092 [Emiliania huxleyi CCMP1516]EOD37812.1 hypothetical protein EMIHUDRAFT_225073 [Emiliania huxleyi CCMP1516]|eukprot:XP_005767537.1 hypothetical protein EMIHUDRAFT_246092 [Emiliania huxleyi CCMP1516]
MSGDTLTTSYQDAEEALSRAKLTAERTERVGAHVLGTLGDQRQQLLGAADGLEAADHELGRTKQTISDLFARLARRRRVALLPPSSLSQLLNSTTTGDPRPCRRCLIGTAAVLALIAAVLLYWKLRNAFGGGG